MRFGFLARLFLWAARRWRLVLILALVAVAASGLLASRLRFDTDILNLLPRHDPAIAEYIDALERFGGTDVLLVVVRVPEGRLPEPYEMLVDDLGPRLDALPQIDRVDYRIGAPEELLSELFPKALLFLDEGEREVLAERVSSEGLRDRTAELRRLLTTPQGSVLAQVVKIDPFGLSQLVLDRLEESRGNFAVDWTSGYYLSEDQRLLLLVAEPASSAQDMEFVEEMVAAVEAEVAASVAAWPEILGPEVAVEDGPPPPEVVLGGTYVTGLGDYRLIRGDLIRNILTSAVLVLGLFLIAFRRLGPLLFAAVPLVCGLVLTFGFSAVAFGALSSATSGVAALLIGLGIDFVIVSYGRYVEERNEGKGLEEALAVTATSSGRAVVVGAVTTAATFFAFLVTDFTGLRQMGWLTGTGILFCMVAVLLMLPALLAWDEHRRRRRGETGPPTLHIHSFGVARLARWSGRHPKTTLAVGAVLTLVAAVAAFGLRFEQGMSSMRPEGSQGIEVANEVAESFQSGFNAMMLVVRGDSLEELFDRAETATSRARELVDEGVLLGTSSITSFVPSPERQREALEWIEAGRRSGLLDPERIEAEFAAALAEQGMRAQPFERGLELFARATRVTEVAEPEEFATTDQARQLLERGLQRDGDGWVSVVTLYPPLNQFRREAPPQVEALAESLPGVTLTGPNVVNAHMRDRVRFDAVSATTVGFVLVFFLLWIDFGRPGDAALSLTPLLVGLVWMLGAMGGFGIAMNFMNVFVSTMIIGIGVDYGIHAVHRWREASSRGREALEGEVVETGKAIVVAALSTCAGFGSLATSSFPGLRSTGLVAILGAVFTALVAITLLPAWMSLRQRWEE